MLDIKWTILIVVLSQIVLYAARLPMHRAIRSIGDAIAGTFSLAADWWKKLGSEMTKRSGELVLESGREGAEVKIEREFRRIESTFARDLAEFPKLQRKLDDLLTKAQADYQECGATPAPSPEWGDLVKALGTLPSMGNEKIAGKFVDEVRKSVLESEKRAREDFRDTTSKRHKILGGMSVHWAEIRKLLERTGKSAELALASTARIDGYMARYEDVLRQNKATQRVLSWVTLRTFVISGLVMAVALGGAFINFQLIALPMSELVPAGGRLMGLPVPSIAALVLVLMEIAAGIFVLETLGITNLFPQLAALSSARRKGILSVAFAGLFLLAAIESSLAILREQIVAAESMLKLSLSGAPEATALQPISSNIPLIGQAVLGFILPWILAMIAIPLEMLVNTAGPVFLLAFSMLAAVLGHAFRTLANAMSHLTQTINSLYDVYVILPLRIETALQRNRNVFELEQPDTRHQAAAPAQPRGKPGRSTSDDAAATRLIRSETRETEVVS